jgi:hypothetical protein
MSLLRPSKESIFVMPASTQGVGPRSLTIQYYRPVTLRWSSSGYFLREAPGDLACRAVEHAETFHLERRCSCSTSWTSFAQFVWF